MSSGGINNKIQHTMKTFFVLFALIFGFYSCAIFKCDEEYYPCAYESLYDISFPYLHNYCNNLEMNLTSLTDTVHYGEPLEVLVTLINRSETDTIYYEYFNSNFVLKDVDGKIHERISNKYAMSDIISPYRDEWGRLFRRFFNSNRILFPKDSVVLYNEGFIYKYNFSNNFKSGEYYLSCNFNHVEFDTLYNPVETVITSNEIKFVIL